jgi:hypothetical protein
VKRPFLSDEQQHRQQWHIQATTTPVECSELLFRAMVALCICLLFLVFGALQCCGQHTNTKNENTLRAVREEQLKRNMDRLFEAMQNVSSLYKRRTKQLNSVKIHCRCGSFSGAYELYHLDESLHKERVFLEKAMHPLLDRYAGNFCECLMVAIDAQRSIYDQIEREATWLSWAITGKQPSQSELGKWLAEQFTEKVTSWLQKWRLKV